MKTFALLCLTASLLVVAQSDSTTDAPTSSQDSDKSTTVGGSTVSKTPQELRQKIKEQVENLIESCKSQHKLTPEQAKIATDVVVPKTEAEKCFLDCIYSGLSLTKDGAFNEAGAKMLAQQRFANSPDELAKANTMIDTCTKEAIVKDANEKCALGRLIRECFVKHGAKIQFFPKP
uniref:Secreted Odorant Binding Protein Family protein n=1 Tax=Pristhesancus plagipennis TaxID=1955184 RepID=A0A2K8JM61_PRIPG|nr:secreted Odorant Binding Protein Family protein [Pristhesancus plagipennis]